MEFCPPRLGSDRRIFELLTRLPNPINTHFIVFPPSRAMLGLLPFPPAHQEENEKTIKRGVRAHYLFLPPPLRRMWRYYILGYVLTLLYIFPKAFKTIKRIDPDILILNYPSAYTGLLGLVLSKVLRKKVIVDFNDMIADYTSSLFHESREHVSKIHTIMEEVIKRFLTFIQNWIAVNADLVLTPSTSIIEHAENVGIKNIYLVPNGVDTSIFNPAKYYGSPERNLRYKYHIRDNERLVVYMGRLDEWAGAQLVLKCVKRLENSQVKFLLIGEGQCETACRASNIIFSGPIPYQSVPEYLAAADLVLVPMQHDVIGNAASPVKLFEAMAMMKTVIASATKGICDVVKNNEDGILLPPDEEAWSRAILHILENPSAALKLGRNARKKVEREFDWNILASKLYKLLTQLLENKHKETEGFLTGGRVGIAFGTHNAWKTKKLY